MRTCTHGFSFCEARSSCYCASLGSALLLVYRGGGRSFVMVRPKGEGMGPPKGVPKRGGGPGASPGKSFENQP